MGDAEKLPPGSDSELFIDHARWLMEWHSKRSESITARAVSLLGFVGVVLALMFQGAALNLKPSGYTWALLTVTLVAFVTAGICSLMAIMVRSMSVPSVDNLRDWWVAHVRSPKPGTMAPQFAEAYLNSLGSGGNKSPVSESKIDADARAKFFRSAVIATGVGLVSLSILLFNVLNLIWK